MTDPTIETVFNTLDKWRHLPKYQLERRADIFFAMFLPDVLENHYGPEFDRNVIPEFPLRKETLWPDTGSREANLSVNVDYAAFTKDGKQVFFVELKTDIKSLRPRQSSYLKRASELKFKELVKGVLSLKKKSKEREKYDCLLECLKVVPVDAPEHKPRIVYIQPKYSKENHQDHAEYIYFDEFASVVEGRGEIGERFAQSLKSWVE